jgi:cytochrome c6
MAKDTSLWLAAALLIFGATQVAGCAGGARDSGRTGEELFLTYCSGCHPNGGNALYPGKTLDRMTLAANGITTPRGIVAKMRHPDPGMKVFDRQTISDADALKVAEYVFATFR